MIAMDLLGVRICFTCSVNNSNYPHLTLPLLQLEMFAFRTGSWDVVGGEFHRAR